MGCELDAHHLRLRCALRHGGIICLGQAQPARLEAPLRQSSIDRRGVGARRDIAERLCEPNSAWLAEPSELFGRALLLCEDLPAGEQFCAMMDGRWVEHGWGRRDVTDN